MLDHLDGEAALMNSVVGFVGSRDVIQVIGPDAASYLHGQMSQDIEGLAVGDSKPSLLLQPQGKIEAWVRVTRTDAEAFWLDTDLGFGEAVVERLERFKLRVDAEITLVAMPMVALRGPLTPDAAELEVPPDGMVLPPLAADRSSSPGGLDLLGPTVSVPAGIDEGPAELLDLDRIMRGVPAMGPELNSSTIPAAAGVVDVSVDFDKGCYVGQELVARVDSRGNNTPSRLCALSIAGTSDSLAGAELMADGAVIGTITSVAPMSGGTSRGLGYIKRAATPPTSAAVSSGDTTLEVEVTNL